ncbi:MAG: DUF7475 family protein [Candidatus Kariarchaeaceae archaeon]|jgi:hypothetical protein
MLIQRLIVGLTGFTALVHLYLAIGSFGDSGSQTLAIIFLLNFIGYIFLLGVLFLVASSVRAHTLLGISLMVYAFVTILAYGLVNYQGSFSDLISPLGIITKIAELALIILIFIDIRSYEGTEILEN